MLAVAKIRAISIAAVYLLAFMISRFTGFTSLIAKVQIQCQKQ
jgi:hypothetical protein